MLHDTARWLPALLVLGLTGCGSYTGTDADIVGTATGTVGTPTKNCDELFARIEPRLDFCRNCHVPDGVANVTDGKKFMLSHDKNEDLVNLIKAVGEVGTSNGTSRILTMASDTDTTRKHSAGAPWPVSSLAYSDMSHWLQGQANPAACVTGAGTDTPQQPLLGSKHAQHVWQTFCEGDGTAAHPKQSDAALLPPDPRSEIVAGANAGKAVFFNAYWQDCHAQLRTIPNSDDPATPENEDVEPNEREIARTCGDFRSRRERGRSFLLDILPTRVTSFSGSGGLTADAYNDTWKKWGLTERPANFDELYTLRYGLNHAPFDNPYPVKLANGTLENPNAPGVNGGSGQLPLGLRQLKDDQGKWTGEIGTSACYSCHGGQFGDPLAGDPEVIGFESLGLGNNNYDTPMSGQDSSPFAGSPAGALLPGMSVESVFNLGIKQRGQNNAVGAFELLVTLLDLDSLGINPNPAKIGASPTGVTDEAHPLAHTQDTPAWWNYGSRPRKFFDAGVSNDSTRIIMAAGGLGEIFSENGAAYRNRIKDYDQDLSAFFLSLKSPTYPKPIDEAKATRGAILFHNKDLWADPAKQTLPKPAGGNGSCASCHGAYSPRYVNDPAYLAKPSWEGIAAHIVPVDAIGTDRARSDMLTPTLRMRWDTTFWGYNDGGPGWVAPENKDPFTETADDMWPGAADLGGALPAGDGVRPVGACGWEKDVIGYQAPPLYGTWATAPYFHNGSVPTIEAVLDSSKRHALWRRQLQTIGPVTGFDQRLSAYDFTALGWKHDDLACTDIPGTEQLNCNPVQEEGPSLTQLVGNLLAMGGLTGAVPVETDPAPGAIDKRLVFDTRILGNANTGHEFTDVLTKDEREAIIEYLKTL